MTTGLDASQLFAAGEFRYLLDFLDANDYRVVDCLAQRTARAPSTVSFRYDIHWRDIHCGYGFLGVHRERAIPGSFFLLHDYTQREREREADFVALARQLDVVRKAGAPVELGFHDSPVDRYLMWKMTGGDELKYVAWLGKEGVRFFTRLAQKPRAREQFDAAVCKSLVASVDAARRALGPIRLSACHGGKLSQVLRPRLAELGPAGDVVRACFAENWLTEERLASAGLVGDVECFKRQAPEIAAITEGGGHLIKMCGSLQRYAAVRRPVVALVHPASWGEKASRDGEWSQLLELPKREHIRVVVSVNPPTLIRELGSADAEPFERAIYTESNKLDPKLVPELEARVVSHGLLLELMADPRHSKQIYDVTWGKSLLRYGPCVVETLKACLPGPAREPPTEQTSVAARAAAVAGWLETEMRSTSVKPRLSASELAYFLFSSSQRGTGLSAIVSHFRRSNAALHVIDHGAGIGFIGLLLGADMPLASVRCSEVKPQFIEAGKDLWTAIGQGDVISFDRCSVTEFQYSTPVDLIFFGHMLYRVPPEQRSATLGSALSALAPGGMLVVNELMNRPDLDATYAHPCLTSDELLTILEQVEGLEIHSVDAANGKLNILPARERPSEFFKRSDNFVVAVRGAAQT